MRGQPTALSFYRPSLRCLFTSCIPILLCRFAGQVGYIVAGMKDVKEAQIGDTLYLQEQPVEALPGFKPAKAMVFAGKQHPSLQMPVAVRLNCIQMELKTPPWTLHNWTLVLKCSSVTGRAVKHKIPSVHVVLLAGTVSAFQVNEFSLFINCTRSFVPLSLRHVSHGPVRVPSPPQCHWETDPEWLECYSAERQQSGSGSRLEVRMTVWAQVLK